MEPEPAAAGGARDEGASDATQPEQAAALDRHRRMQAVHGRLGGSIKGSIGQNRFLVRAARRRPRARDRAPQVRARGKEARCRYKPCGRPGKVIEEDEVRVALLRPTSAAPALPRGSDAAAAGDGEPPSAHGKPKWHHADCFFLALRTLARRSKTVEGRAGFNVRACDRFDASSSAVLRELDESHRFVQKSAESTSMRPCSSVLKCGGDPRNQRLDTTQVEGPEDLEDLESLAPELRARVLWLLDGHLDWLRRRAAGTFPPGPAPRGGRAPGGAARRAVDALDLAGAPVAAFARLLSPTRPSGDLRAPPPPAGRADGDGGSPAGDGGSPARSWSSGEDADVAAAIALSGMVDRPGERPDPNLYRTLSDHSLAAEAPPGPPAARGPAARAAAGGLERPPSDHSLDLLAVPGLAADRRSRSREDLARGALYLPRSPVAATAPLFRSRSDESLLARLSRYDTPPPDDDDDDDDDGPGLPL